MQFTLDLSYNCFFRLFVIQAGRVLTDRMSRKLTSYFTMPSRRRNFWRRKRTNTWSDPILTLFDDNKRKLDSEHSLFLAVRLEREEYAMLFLQLQDNLLLLYCLSFEMIRISRRGALIFTPVPFLFGPRCFSPSTLSARNFSRVLEHVWDLSWISRDSPLSFLMESGECPSPETKICCERSVVKSLLIFELGVIRCDII